jgi:arylsulfate sulfotransferase
MKILNKYLLLLPFTLGLLTVLSAPAFATVTIGALTPSHTSPQPIGKSISWVVTATDTNTGPLTFQFNIAPPNGKLTMVKDFNVGTSSGGIWTARPFLWVPTGIEGAYQIQVVAKDFISGESTSQTVAFNVSAVATGSSPVVERTANALVALFSASSCAAGSDMRVAFQEQTGSAPETVTNWMACHPPASMTFEIAGMYPNTAYNMFAQTKTGSKIANGPAAVFTTGALPADVPFPAYTAKPAGTDKTYPVILHNPIVFGGEGKPYPDVATDLSGNIIWYYYPNDTTHSDVLTRPLPGGGNLSLQDDLAWDPTVTQEQFLRQTDLAGNIVRETNVGAIQRELKAMGAVDWGPCSGVANPVVGAACPGAFTHDAIQTLPNGYTAALMDLEKILPAGTQGDTSGKPVDIIGDMIVVLDTNWQVVWYWDSFDPSHGGNGYPELPVSRTAVLGETCGASTSGCPPLFLLGSNIASLAHDWLHPNTLYYWPHNGGAASQPGDLIWSSRHQDWVFKIDYRDRTGSGKILWRMGPSGDFQFNNAYGDLWPWFSHQHDVGIENGGAGPMTIFDNGNTRVSKPALSTGGVPGLGSACGEYDCHSRGMSVAFDENAMTVTVSPNGVSLDLGAYSTAMGSAQLLGNGHYFFENPIVLTGATTTGHSLEFAPTPAAPQVGKADILMNVVGPQHYRGWQMPSLYFPPTT